MNQAHELILRTKKKFIVFTMAGGLIVSIVSAFALSYHHQVIVRQTAIQELYSLINFQVSTINKISNLSESFRERTMTENERNQLVVEFNQLIIDLSRKNYELENWLASYDDIQFEEIQRVLKDEKVGEKIQGYIERARSLTNPTENTSGEIRRSVRFLSYNSRAGLRNVFDFVNQKILTKQAESLELLERMGMLLVGLCILQVILVWLLVFRPLYSAILLQHGRLSEALLDARSANRSKTDFLANISHEIRTPMTAILGYAEVLRRDALEENERDNAVGIIEQNANHLLGLVDEILDVAKMEAGKFTVEREPVDLLRLLNEVYSLINVKAEDKGIELIFKNKGKIPQLIFADGKRIKQILFNIVGNAIKFTDHGHVELTVSYHNFDGENLLSFLIKDTGCGIAPDQVSRLFRPFEQADTSTGRSYGGSGLGLVLSRGLARKMGGNIVIEESKPDVGTSIRITLDAGPGASESLVARFSSNISDDEDDPVIEHLLDGVRLLVVDDAKENARLFKMYLVEAGASVDTAHDGQQAIDLIEAQSYDLVLLDLQMPGKDGYQVVQELRQKSYDLPILALTAHAMKEEKIKTKKAGFNGHITKPVKSHVLIETVAEFITPKNQHTTA